MAETSNFYLLYDIARESIPGEEEWALRYDQFVKHIPTQEEENVSEDENKITEEGESVKKMEDERPSQFEENKQTRGTVLRENSDTFTSQLGGTLPRNSNN